MDVTPIPKQGKAKKPSRVSADARWANAVKERDGWKCQYPGCSYVGPQVEAHHRQTRKQRPDLIHEASNGVSLCGPWINDHHAWVHRFPVEAEALSLLGGETYEKARSSSSVFSAGRQQDGGQSPSEA